MQTRHVLLVVLALFTVALAPTVTAHKTITTEDGAVEIVWGFRNEPATTWTTTDLDLVLTDVATGSPILGAETTITTAQLKYGDEVLDLALAPQHGAAGRYTSQVITMTRAGLYVLHLEGAINGSAVNKDIPATHETTAISETYFPATDRDPYDAGDADAAALEAEIAALKTRIAALEAKADTQSQTPATVTPKADTPAFTAVAVIGVLAALVILRRRV